MFVMDYAYKNSPGFRDFANTGGGVVNELLTPILSFGLSETKDESYWHGQYEDPITDMNNAISREAQNMVSSLKDALGQISSENPIYQAISDMAHATFTSADVSSYYSNLPSLASLEAGIAGEINSLTSSATRVLKWAHNSLFVSRPLSPIIIDMDGNGVHAIPLSSSNVLFDLNSDGHAEHVSWASPTDGLLAMDRNGNGSIDNGSELFGSGSGGDGFAILSQLDSNGDGTIDSRDTAFGQLRIWQDSNSNGIADPGELKTLPDAGITSISLNAQPVGQSVDGNPVGNGSQATFFDGHTADAWDVWFQNDQTITRQILPDGFQPSEASTLQPYVASYGSLDDVRYALNNDPSLMATSQDMVDKAGSGDLQGFKIDLEQYVSLWSGNDSDGSSTEPYGVSHQHIETMEAVHNATAPSEVDLRVGAEELENEYHAFTDEIAIKFLVQSPQTLNETGSDSSGIIPLAMSHLSYDVTNDLVTGDFQGAAMLIGAGIELGQVSLIDGAQILQYMKADYTGSSSDWSSLMSSVLSEIGTTSSDRTVFNTIVSNQAPDGGVVAVNDDPTTIASSTIIINVESASGPNVIHGSDDGSLLTGTAGDDFIIGGNGNDTITAGNGFDVVYGGKGNDILIGDAKHDLTGGVGADNGITTFMFDKGDGNDVIQTAGGNGGHSYIGQNALNSSYHGTAGTGNTLDQNTGAAHIVYGDDVSPSDVSVTATADGSLMLSIASTGDSVVVKGYFSDQLHYDASGHVVNDVDRMSDVTFSDGTVWKTPDIETKASTPSSAGGDSLWGDPSDNTIKAVAGNNLIHGGDGNDILTGGAGVDTIYGDAGNDTITGGSGNDVIDGGAGDNTARYTYQSSWYAETADSNGHITVSASHAHTSTQQFSQAISADGVDTTSKIQHFQFSNGTISYQTPIIIDLEDKGTTLLEADAGVRYDMDGDGKADATGWMGSGSGMLFMDRDGNGTVTDAREISFTDDAQGALTDVQGLRAHDLNGDGILDAQEADAQHILIWADRNSDGIVDHGEIGSLHDFGIASISLQTTSIGSDVDVVGNLAFGQGYATMEDGSSRLYLDAALSYHSSVYDAGIVAASNAGGWPFA